MIIIITLMIIVNHDNVTMSGDDLIPCQLQPEPGVLSNKQAARRYHLFLQLKRKNNRILDHIDIDKKKIKKIKNKKNKK